MATEASPRAAGVGPTMLRSTVALLLVAACLALAATAQAATPFTAGTGIEPTVAVGSDGSGHVAWETSGEPVGVGYCRLSPGTSACNHIVPLPFPGTEAFSAGRAQVFAPAPNKVVIVAGCWNCPSGVEDRVYDWISTDNGESFIGPTPTQIGTDLGNGNGFGGRGTWLDGSSTYVAADGSHVKAQQFAGIPTPGQGVEFATGGLFAYKPSVVQVPGTNKLVAAVNDLDVVKYAVYNGLPLTPSNVNEAANWATDLPLPAPEPDNGDTMLNSGPSGATLTYGYESPGRNWVGLRRFDPATNSFGAPAYLQGSDPIDESPEEPASTQDPAGRIHVVWFSRYAGNRLRYTVSDTTGSFFSTPATLAAGEEFYQPEVAAGADGHGFATWSNACCGSAIRVVPLDPYSESAPVTPPSSPSSGGGSSPTTTTTTPTTPPSVGVLRSGKTTLRPGQGTTFRFRSSRAGLAVLSFEKKFTGVKGRRKGKKACLSLTRRRLRALRHKTGSARALHKLLKKRRCHGFRRIGQLRKRASAGLNTIRFSGRLAGRKLSPGRYRARLVVRDSAGLVSRVETLRFKVVAKHGKRRAKKRHHGR